MNAGDIKIEYKQRQKEIAEAVAAEREACAKIAESEPRVWDVNAPDPQKRIAAKIRSRTNP